MTEHCCAGVTPEEEADVNQLRESANAHGVDVDLILKRLAQFKLERHKRTRHLAFVRSPATNEIRDAAIAAPTTVQFDLCKQVLGRAPVLLEPMSVGLRGGFTWLDNIPHFLSGCLAVNAYAAFCIAGRLSK